ncbi:MAG: prolipoprotein diacylglyceryl transferase [Chloroflexi bacterium]|nr:prolipoprotein diacylglyceryl transferase [Chloroflexota bacterium]MBI5704482.1 prolipoprotein diacylglyceryl transferase [Chloroflexota bacterium]GER78838.1 prolipoprotein diacylglyceryl transferase [Candidatus Denitrolinea symbiosum]
MITISIDPIIFNIGHFAVRWYSLILLIAIGIGIWLTAREAERRGFKKDDIYDAAIWIIVGGLLGARLFHVLDHWSHEYAADPIRALYIWEGGLAIWGALIGGLITGALVAWRRGWRFPKLLDAAAPGLVLAQAIGRIACVITGDAMGKPTDGPFGFAYTNPNVMVPQLGVYYTPMPVYELVINLGIFVVLWGLRKRIGPDGRLFLVYLTLYSLERFFLAFTSSYRIIAFGLTQSQIVAIFGLVISLIFLALIPRKLNKQSM